LVGLIGLLIALNLYGESAWSEEIPIPGVAGTYVTGLINGELTGAVAISSEDTYFRVEGSLVPGIQSLCNLPESDHPSGSEVHLMLYPVNQHDWWAIGSVELDPTEGRFTVDGLVHYVLFGQVYELPCPFGIFSGDFEFELMVGSNPFEFPACLIGRPATVTIDSVKLLSADWLPTEDMNWGSLKAIFR